MYRQTILAAVCTVALLVVASSCVYTAKEQAAAQPQTPVPPVIVQDQQGSPAPVSPEPLLLEREEVMLGALGSVNALEKRKMHSAPGRARRDGGGVGYDATAGVGAAYCLSAPPPPEFNTESYTAITENRFLPALDNPLSTFSIDVDVASYANTRRFLTGNSLPPKDAVRIEEFVNYFTYDYPDPEGEHPFSITAEVGACPWKPEHRLVHIGIQGERMDTEQLPPGNLVFLLDVSGSMNSPDKLPLLKSAMKMLVKNLRAEDRVAIVVYAGAAGLVLPSTKGTERETILGAIEKLSAGGSTAGGAGIKLAYTVASEHYRTDGNNRVILATDGDFNIGASSDAEMVRLIEQEREKGVFLTVLGFGTGNYKDSKMEQIADKGNGNYAYIDNVMEAKKVLVSEMGGTLLTIAKDVKIQVEFNPARVAAYRLIGYENRALANEDFNDDRKDAGELGAGHSVTALYEVVPVGVKTDVVKVDELKYQSRAVHDGGDELLTVKFRYKKPKGTESILIAQVVNDVVEELPSDNFRFSSAVAGFGMLLRDSEHKGGLTYEQVKGIAKHAMGADTEGYRHEFVRMVERAELLASEQRS